MELDTQWWTHPLAAEIHKTLRMQECKLPKYVRASPQLSMRRALVDWLAPICERFELCRAARHLTILIMDHVMDHFDIQHNQLRLVALGCLLVATKFEEREVQIPRSASLNEYVPQPGHTAAEYLQMELIVLDFLKWNVGMPTTAHFLEYHLHGGISSKDQCFDETANQDDMLKYLSSYIEYFAEVSLQEYHYRSFRPSVISAACIAAARKCLRFTPTWSNQLQFISGYDITDINPVLHCLLKTHDMDLAQTSHKQKDRQMEDGKVCNFVTKLPATDSNRSNFINQCTHLQHAINLHQLNNIVKQHQPNLSTLQCDLDIQEQNNIMKQQPDPSTLTTLQHDLDIQQLSTYLKLHQPDHIIIPSDVDLQQLSTCIKQHQPAQLSQQQPVQLGHESVSCFNVQRLQSASWAARISC